MSEFRFIVSAVLSFATASSALWSLTTINAPLAATAMVLLAGLATTLGIIAATRYTIESYK